MNPSPPPAADSARGLAPRWRKPLLVAAFLALVAAFVWNALPSGGGYPTDLTRIGQGRPALVLAYDSNYSGGMAVMELMNAIRDDYAERVDFLVAHLGTPEAREFAGRHEVVDGVVLLFGPDGRRVAALQPQSATELREALAQAFSL